MPLLCVASAISVDGRTVRSCRWSIGVRMPELGKQMEGAHCWARSGGAAARRSAGPVYQPRQRSQHASASGGRRWGPALPAVLLERPSGGRLQVTRQHRGLSRRARDARALRWSRDDDQYRCLREEHDRSHQQARLPLSARAAQRRSLDGDGAPLERSALARSRNGGSRNGHP